MWELDYKERWRQKLDAFELWCWRRLLRVPWTARSNQSILKEINWKDWYWSWNSNTLATWCEELTHLKRLWCWERLKAGAGDDRGWDGWMTSLTQRTWVWASFRTWWWTKKPGVLQSWNTKGSDMTKQLNWLFKMKFYLIIKKNKIMLLSAPWIIFE